MIPFQVRTYSHRTPAAVLVFTAAEAAATGDRTERNKLALNQLASLTDTGSWRRQRDRIVRDNLPLVYAIAGRMSRNGSLPFEDLSQVGSLGLLRAIEAFQPSKGRSLSSFAVPYIRGAMKQEIRDRQSLMKIPRDLWELRQRASALQERNRQSLALPLALGALARSLDCEGQKLQEAINLNSITEMRSLDAPRCQGRGAEDHGPNLVEDLADPASLDRAEADISGHDQAGEQADQEPSPSPQLLWLRQRLAALPQLEQALIRGHLNSNASWVELGRELNLHPRQAQRRYQAGLSRLKREAQAWSQGAEGLI